jgi:small-conductance mechanosensitive channel
MTHVSGFDIPLPLILAGPATVLLFGGIGWLVGRLLTMLLSRGARRTATDIDDLILKAVQGPICLATALGGAWLALRALPLPGEMDAYLNRGWIVAATLLLVAVGLRMINSLTREVVQKSPTLAGASGIIRVVGRVVVLSLGGVMILQSLGIAVEPLIASLGIGSLAVGFALKDTLSNLFAGVYLFADRPLRVGDYVKIEGGEEGFVEAIGWRATRIRMLANNMIIVPNAKLSESILTNYDLPEPQMSVVLKIAVACDTDPTRLLQVLVEEAKAGIPEIPGLLADPEPIARFSPGFNDNTFEFSLIVWVSRYVDQYQVQSELRRKIFTRFHREGIHIPFQQQTIRAPELERALTARLAARTAEGGSDIAPSGTPAGTQPGTPG